MFNTKVKKRTNRFQMLRHIIMLDAIGYKTRQESFK